MLSFVSSLFGNGSSISNYVGGGSSQSGGSGAAPGSAPLSAADGSCQDDVVLDPLSTLIRIYTLFYQPAGTKIYIDRYAHALCFDQPIFYQGITRCQRGASRHDIHVLKQTIQQAITWYNLEHPQIRFIARGAIKGLEKFALCYSRRSNLALHSIEYYILLISNELKLSPADLLPQQQGQSQTTIADGKSSSPPSSPREEDAANDDADSYAAAPASHGRRVTATAAADEDSGYSHDSQGAANNGDDEPDLEQASYSKKSTIGNHKSSPLQFDKHKRGHQQQRTPGGVGAIATTSTTTATGEAKKSKPIAIPGSQRCVPSTSAKESARALLTSSPASSLFPTMLFGSGDAHTHTRTHGMGATHAHANTNAHALYSHPVPSAVADSPSALESHGSLLKMCSTAAGSLGSLSIATPIPSPTLAAVDGGEDDVITGGLKQLWTPQQLNIIHAIFLELEIQQRKNNVLEIQSLLESVENILRPKDKRIEEIVKAAADLPAARRFQAATCASASPASSSCSSVTSPSLGPIGAGQLFGGVGMALNLGAPANATAVK